MGESIAEQVHHALRGWDEAFSAARDAGLTVEEAEKSAVLSWGAMLPIVDSIHAATIFIAHVAAGQSRGWLTGEQSRGMMYTAQCAISALRAEKKGR